MRRRAAILFVLAALAPWGCTRDATDVRRSIVLVVIDTLRRDHLPVHGGTTDTPHLSSLAERGVALDALASFHQTSMSMGALFTGRTPSLESGDPAAALAWQPASWCGMARFGVNAAGGACLPATLPTLAEALAERGYHTVGVVANALLHDPAGFSRGFARWAEVGSRDDLEAAQVQAGGRKRGKAARFAHLRSFEHVHAALRAELADLPARPEAPLFLYVHYLDVHDWLYTDGSYAEAVERMDRGIGELLGILADHDLLEEAALVVTSDHGELIDDRERALPHHPLHLGNPSFRDVLDVPLLLVGADDVALPPLVRSEDLHRILLALAGAPLGASEDLAPDELLVSEKGFQTYQRGRFKSMLAREGAHPLIDLESDPLETRDATALHPEVAEAHRRRVAELTEALATEALPTDPRPLDPEWTERLRAMGYLE